MSGATHLRGIVIAGGLAALAIALAFITLAMNQTASKAATPNVVLSLHARAAKTKASAAKKQAPKVKPKPVDPNLKAALAAGLPRSVAEGLAASPVVVVELTSTEDPVAEQALGEAQDGAKLGGASFVEVDVDIDSTTVQTLARLLNQVPDAPAALIYTRPATLSLTLSGYVDRTVIQQAVTSAEPLGAGSSPAAGSSAGASSTGSTAKAAGGSA